MGTCPWHQASADNTQGIFAHDGADFGWRETFVHQGLRHLNQLRGVEPHGGRAVIIRSQGDMLDAYQITDMLHRLGCRAWARVTQGAIPIANANDAAGFGHTAHFVVGQVAVDLTCRLYAAMAGDDWPRGHRQHFCNTFMRQMGDVDNHALRFHTLYNVATKGGQPAFFQAMHRTRKFIVKEMCQASHAKTSIIQPVQIGHLPFQILEPFNGQHSAHGALILLPRGK